MSTNAAEITALHVELGEATIVPHSETLGAGRHQHGKSGTIALHYCPRLCPLTTRSMVAPQLRLLRAGNRSKTTEPCRVQVHLIDGTYELFRHFFAVPKAADEDGREVGAVRGVLGSVLSMLERDATHVGVATDRVIESFRNDLYSGYKTGEGVAPTLLSQFPILEAGLEAMGVLVWPMVEYEADDALASAAVKASADDRVTRVLVCTPDKDLTQCVVGTRVVQLDRRRKITRDESGVIAKFGVAPRSIPDYLALVGDSADGFPGVAGWGPEAASKTLSRYRHLEDIPKDWRTWHPSISRARSLSHSLFGAWSDALLFRTLATLRTDVPVFSTVDDLRWKGPLHDFSQFANQMKAPDLALRAASAAGNSESTPARCTPGQTDLRG